MSRMILLAVFFVVGASAAAQDSLKDKYFDKKGRKPLLPFKELPIQGGGATQEVVFSHDGTKMAVGGGANVTVWNIADGQELVRTQLPYKTSWHHMVFAADDKTLVWHGQEDPLLRVFDVKTGRQVREFRPPAPFYSFCPDGMRIACTAPTGYDLFDIATAKKLVNIGDAQGRYPVFTPDGKQVFFNSKEAICFHDVKMAQLLKVVKHEANFQIGTGYAFPSPDGNFVAAMEHPHAVQILDVRAGKRIATVRTDVPCYRVAFSRDNQSLLFVHSSEAVLYNIVAEKVIHRFYPPDNYTQSAFFTPDDKKVVIIGSKYQKDGWQYVLYVHELPARFLDPAAARIDDVPLEKLWPDLQTDNDLRLEVVNKAFKIAPKQAVAFFRKEVLPVSKDRQKQVEDWIAQMDDEDYLKRELAMKSVHGVAHEFVPMLQERQKSASAGEIRNRLTFVLRKLSEEKAPLSLVRESRVVTLLEQLATPEALDFLRDLAQGAPQARLTLEAQAALERLSKKKAPR